jgi:pimeloyl-ACP methyl ester carboxylesterase
MDGGAGVIDGARVAVIGGSHGGFLTGNLVGQHPGRFRCGVLRNPVMDLGLMIHVSDIPDWVYVEAWGTEARAPACPWPATTNCHATLAALNNYLTGNPKLCCCRRHDPSEPTVSLRGKCPGVFVEHC